MSYDQRIIDLAAEAAIAAGKNARVAPHLLSADIIFTLADAVADGRIALGGGGTFAAQPQPEVESETAEDAEATRIYVRWSDDGEHIRKWSRDPFPEGEPVDAIGAPVNDLAARVASYAETCTGLEPRRILREAATALRQRPATDAAGVGPVEREAFIRLLDATDRFNGICSHSKQPMARMQGDMILAVKHAYRVLGIGRTEKRAVAHPVAADRAAVIEECAKVADDLACVAAASKGHISPLSCDTNEAWRRVEDAALDIATAIRALSQSGEVDRV